jgi:hypothetical protein
MRSDPRAAIMALLGMVYAPIGPTLAAPGAPRRHELPPPDKPTLEPA